MIRAFVAVVFVLFLFSMIYNLIEIVKDDLPKRKVRIITFSYLFFKAFAMAVLMVWAGLCLVADKL